MTGRTGTDEERATPRHCVIVRRQWSRFAVVCGTCDLYERHDDETTAYREAERHALTVSAAARP